MISIKTKYTLTKHAHDRFHQRVRKGDPKAWTNLAIERGIPLEDGNIRYGDYLIVLKDKMVVTISYYNDQQLRDFKHDVVKTIVNKFKRKLKPLLKRKKETQIEIYEAKIRELKARNPKVVASIAEHIVELEKDLNAVSTEINDLYRIAQMYHIQRGDLNG
ncbi:hypothetical protein ISO99_04880 [Staphylococcus sp. 18_1_E_LY]|uniref:Uncharacterized protein n=1 Tax=Staphylococcus lloydii TaxID=2781774 RepID=A0A7T1AZ73_9STAP|nr:hypothetical protein [Staphylococcus lloydii]MBF7019241.1 hypothetical protein [Staphylococcus lloydii]MBF7026969.1 hypothetical protein [Staphylococcus lloydii]QPM74616.1 hypothetical protein ISP08_09740 [Staphylococcus lloydii]